MSAPTPAGAVRARPPGRPRSSAADEAILAAGLDLLVQDGYRALSMEAVRLRAGVGKATVYRRFPNKEALVAAVMERLGVDVETPSDTGSLRGDFGALVEHLTQIAYVPRLAALMPRLMGEAVDNPELFDVFYARLVEPRRQLVRILLRRAIARGELAPDTDLEVAIDALVGPMVYRIIISGGRLERLGRDPLTLFDAVYAGIRAR